MGLKFEVPSAEMIEQHYTLDPDWKQNVGEKAIEAYKKKGQEPPETDPIKVGDIVIEGLKKYMTSGPVIMMVWQGAHSVELVRKLVGGTEPRTSHVGTIRGDFVLDSYMLADGDGRAVLNYKLVQEGILYDVNLDGILE